MKIIKETIENISDKATEVVNPTMANAKRFSDKKKDEMEKIIKERTPKNPEKISAEKQEIPKQELGEGIDDIYASIEMIDKPFNLLGDYIESALETNFYFPEDMDYGIKDAENCYEIQIRMDDNAVELILTLLSNKLGEENVHHEQFSDKICVEKDAVNRVFAKPYHAPRFGGHPEFETPEQFDESIDSIPYDYAGVDEDDMMMLVDEVAHAVNRVLDSNYVSISTKELKHLFDRVFDFLTVHADGADWQLLESKMNESKSSIVLTDDEIDILYDIAEQFTGSERPSEAAANENMEIKTIMDTFKISREQAKQVMIDYLGFEDDLFVSENPEYEF